MQWAILTAAGLLLLGFVLCARLRVLQLLFIPASVTGGIVGLVALQILGRQSETVAGPALEIADTLRGWPSALIAVVFAGLLLERPDRGFKDAMRGAAMAGIMVWIIALGQIAIGLAATWLVIGPALDVPPVFGQLIEAGFAGGHATAAAIGVLCTEKLDFPEGLDLALFMATFGLVYGVVSGIALVNLGVRRGWTRRAPASLTPVRGAETGGEAPSIALGRVRAEVIDPLAFQFVLMTMAIGLGVALRWGFVETVRLLPLERAAPYLDNLPLFLFTLLGGLLLRKIMTVLGVGHLIDGDSVKRIVGIAMEFLIVAAIASLKLSAVVTYLWPLALLVVLGAAWCAFCLLVLSPRLLPEEHWFELGLLNYGMSTATTAQGMMLLRIVDPDLESGAAEHYALAAPLSAPFVGGGVLTLSLPILLGEVVTPGVIVVIVVVMAGLYAVGRAIRRGGVDARA